MKIYVDADACPVKQEIITVAKQANIPVVMVQSFAHFSHSVYPPEVEMIYVDQGVDATDYRILQLTQPGDLIITQDYGLASLLLAKKCLVLHHKGFMYTEENINHLLQARYVNAQKRKSGQRTKGPKPLTKEDKQTFVELLQQLIIKHQIKISDSDMNTT